MLIEVINADNSNKASCKIVVFLLSCLSSRLKAAIAKTIIIDPMIWSTLAFSWNSVMPRMKVSTDENNLVIVTSEISAFFKIDKMIAQLNANKKPFKAKSRMKLKEIAIPKGTHIREHKKAVVVNSTKTTYILLFLRDSFLNTS